MWKVAGDTSPLSQTCADTRRSTRARRTPAPPMRMSRLRIKCIILKFFNSATNEPAFLSARSLFSPLPRVPLTPWPQSFRQIIHTSRHSRLPSGIDLANCIGWPFQMAILVQQLGPHLHPPLFISYILISTSRSGVGRIISYPTHGSVTVDSLFITSGAAKRESFILMLVFFVAYFRFYYPPSYDHRGAGWFAFMVYIFFLFFR